MSERIETLRDWAENRTMAPGDRSDLKWAIRELARLAARVQELEEKSRIDDEQGDLMAEECARLAARVEELEDGYGKCVVNRAELQIEITRLREALERITEISAKDSGYADYARWQMMLTEARRALKEKP